MKHIGDPLGQEEQRRGMGKIGKQNGGGGPRGDFLRCDGGQPRQSGGRCEQTDDVSDKKKGLNNNSCWAGVKNLTYSRPKEVKRRSRMRNVERPMPCQNGKRTKVKNQLPVPRRHPKGAPLNQNLVDPEQPDKRKSYPERADMNCGERGNLLTFVHALESPPD